MSANLHGSTIDIVVAHQGRGIPSHLIPAVFERFGLTQLTDTQGEGSYGLELAIAKAIVELHGGNLGVQSEERRGTTFTVSLPNRTVPKVSATHEEDTAGWARAGNKQSRG